MRGCGAQCITEMSTSDTSLGLKTHNTHQTSSASLSSAALSLHQAATETRVRLTQCHQWHHILMLACVTSPAVTRPGSTSIPDLSPSLCLCCPIVGCRLFTSGVLSPETGLRQQLTTKSSICPAQNQRAQCHQTSMMVTTPPSSQSASVSPNREGVNVSQ